MILAMVVLVWLLCSILSTSITLGYFQEEYKEIAKSTYRTDLGTAWFMGLAYGPFALVLSFFLSGFIQHGLANPFALKYKEKS